VMVSTLASGNTAPYIGSSDIVMFPSIVDVAGLNRVSRMIFSRAAGGICRRKRERAAHRGRRGAGDHQLAGRVTTIQEREKR